MRFQISWIVNLMHLVGYARHNLCTAKIICIFLDISLCWNFILMRIHILIFVFCFCFWVVFWTDLAVQRPSRRLHRRRLFFYPLAGTELGSQPSLTARDRELVSVLEIRIEPGDLNPRPLTPQSVTIPTLPPAGLLHFYDKNVDIIWLNQYKKICKYILYICKLPPARVYSATEPRCNLFS